MASSDARPVPIKNTAFRVTFPILDADGDLVSGATSPDSEVSKDGGSFADCTNEATEIGSTGIYYLDLTSTEMNADTVTVIVKTATSGAKTTVLVMYTTATGILCDLRYINGTAITGTSTQVADGFTAFFNIASGSRALTLASVNQTGDSYARIGSTGSGLTSLAPSSTALSTAQWTNTRAGNLDNLDATVSSRAPSSTALSTAQWTNTRAGNLDNLDAAVSGRATVAGVWANGTRTLTSVSGLTINATVTSIQSGIDVTFNNFTVDTAFNIGALNVADSATFQSGLSITQAATNQPGLAITGNGTGQGILITGGDGGDQPAATFVGAVNFNGAVTIDSTLTVTDTTMLSTLAVDGPFFATNASNDIRGVNAGNIVDQGTAQAGTSTTITLRSAASFADDVLIGNSIFIVSGTGAGQTRPITDNVGSTDVVTVGTAWTTTPDNTSVYKIFSDTPAGSGGGGGLTQQQVRDALKLAPTAGSPDAGSIDKHLDDIQTKTDYMPSATAGASGGLMIAGTNAALTITGNLNVQGQTLLDNAVVVDGALQVLGAVDIANASNVIRGVQFTAADGPVPSGGIIDQGTAQAGTISTIQLRAGALFLNDTLVGNRVWIVSGTGAGQSRTISDWDSSTDTATVSENWITSPDGSSVYKVFSDVAGGGGGGGGGLTAQQTRDAMTLAPTDPPQDGSIDDLLADIITNTASLSGSGAYVVNITVNDGSSVLQNAKVRMTLGLFSYTATTNSSGVASFSLDNGSYTLSISLAGYSFTPVTQVVSGTTTTVKSMTPVTLPTPSSPELCAVVGLLLKPDGTPAAEEIITVQLVSSNGKTQGGQVVSREPVEFETDSNGEVEFELVRTDQFVLPNAYYQVTCEAVNWRKKRLVIGVPSYDLSNL